MPSPTTSDAVSTRNPHAPGGFGRRAAVCVVAAPPRWLPIASSRRLASGPTALRTRPDPGPGQAPKLRRALTLAGCAALPLLAAAAAFPAWAKTIRVTISVPMPSRIDMEGLHKVLLTRFRVDKETPEIDLNHETVAVLRRELKKKTNLDVLDVEPPPLPEESFTDLLANTGFWRKLAEGHGADLVLSGEVGFQVTDRSGYVQQDQISPVTGQRVRRTVFVNREGFNINLHLFFIRGSTGKILYEDRFTGENTVSGGGNDRLAAFYTLFEQIEDDVLGIVGPARKTAQRSLFTE